jgi:hypothetical protein
MAWGYGPFDNKDARDWLEGIRSYVVFAVTKGANHEAPVPATYLEARAAGELILRTMDVFPWEKDLIRLAIDALDRMVADERFMAEWNCGEVFKEMVLGQRTALVRLL